VEAGNQEPLQAARIPAMLHPRIESLHTIPTM
jgi:hypothetical protein